MERGRCEVILMSAVIKTSCSWAAIVTFNTLSFLSPSCSYFMHFFSRTHPRDISWSVLGNSFFRGWFSELFPTSSSKLLLLYLQLLFAFFFKLYFPCRPNLNGNRLHRTDRESPRHRHTKKISRPEHISPYEYGSGEEISLSRTTKYFLYIKTEFVIHNQPAKLLRPNLKLSFTFDVCFCLAVCLLEVSLALHYEWLFFLFREWQREKHQNNGIPISLFSSLCWTLLWLLLQLHDQLSVVALSELSQIFFLFTTQFFFWFEF